MDISVYIPDMTDQMLVPTDTNPYSNTMPVDLGLILFDVLNKMSGQYSSSLAQVCAT
jgi:hypothetical protein